MLVTSGYAQVVARQSCEEVIIIDGIRADGSPYVTSVSTMDSLAARRAELGIKGGRASRWRRDGASFAYDINHHAADWQLAERFSL